MTFYVTPKNQGQLVEYAYGELMSRNVVYVVERRTEGLQMTYRIARQLKGDDGQYWQDEPMNRRWKKISTEEIDSLEVRV